MKREPIINELRALLSGVRAAYVVRKDALHQNALKRHRQKEADRLAAGVYSREEQRTNRERWNR